MEQQERSMGMNRTGLQMSPIDSKAMQAYTGPMPAVDVDASALATVRSNYTVQSRGLGSAPLPGSLSGVVQTGVAMLKGDQPQILLDKLAERLAFERAGVRLYDGLIAKYEALADYSTSITPEALREIRDDEARHFIQCGQAIEQLGGDPTCQTPSADLVGVEGMGLIQVLSDPRTSLSQALHAILTAELSDQAGWEALIALAEAQDQDDLAQLGQAALREEQEHLQRVRGWYLESIGLGSVSPSTDERTSS